MLNDIRSSEKNILCYFNGSHHFSMYKNLFELNSDINFCIYSDKITIDEFVKSTLYRLDNVCFTNNINDIWFKINAFKCFLTTNAQATKAHASSLKIVNLCKKSGIKVFELQHGLFQLGLHYYDVPCHEHFQGDTYFLPSYADEVMTFYPANLENQTVVGYPSYVEKADAVNGEYVLILSNLHWGTYEEMERYQFDTTILRFIEAHPEKIFIWKPHYGEINRLKDVQNRIKIYQKSKNNLLLQTGGNILDFISTEELIKNADYVISTISTVLLDCEKYHKKTFIYRAASTKVLLDKIESKIDFSTYEELENKLKSNTPLCTGHLQKFNNSIFRDRILNSVLPQHTSNELLSNIIEMQSD